MVYVATLKYVIIAIFSWVFFKVKSKRCMLCNTLFGIIHTITKNVPLSGQVAERFAKAIRSYSCNYLSKHGERTDNNKRQ